MRIAQIAPLHEAVPPKLYGGTERVVSYLTEELVALGHQVTLFASGDSVTSACLHAACLRVGRNNIAPSRFGQLKQISRRPIMSVDLNELKTLSLRLIVERKSLIEAMAAVPATERLSSESLQRLAEVSAAGAAVAREIAVHEPHLAWG